MLKISTPADLYHKKKKKKKFIELWLGGYVGWSITSKACRLDSQSGHTGGNKLTFLTLSLSQINKRMTTYPQVRLNRS